MKKIPFILSRGTEPRKSQNWFQTDAKLFGKVLKLFRMEKKLVLEIAPILQLVDKSKFMASIEDFYLGRHLVGF